MGLAVTCLTGAVLGMQVKITLPGQVGERLVIQICISNGCPLLDGVVDGIVKADIPGAFFCGPSKLSTCIQTRVQKNRRVLKGSCSTKCCMYHEEFEM